MLWRKESNKKNALYVDLFASENNELLEMVFMMTKLDNQKPTIKKSSKDSLAQRKKGNDFFTNGQFNKAMEKYNESLCLAPPNSELIGIAYGNRSACFMNLKMYDECLVDIELAKQANYPERLANKLSERKAECLKYIENDQYKTDGIGLQLSFDPDETFASVANVLDVKRDRNGILIATAKENIGVGKTITIEKAFTTYLTKGHTLKCNICLKQDTNLVPCNKCTSAMFCHDKCKDDTIHEGECGLVFSGIADLDAGILKEVRIILMIIDMFTNADELMSFVQQTIEHESMEKTESSSDAKIRYRDFLNLPFSQNGPNSEKFLTSLYFMNKLALEIPKVRTFFNTEKHRRFLMHLLGLHFRITDDNSNWSKRLFEINGQVKSVCTHGVIGLRNRFFGMSCAPNVMNSDHNDCSVFITIRPVKKGEQLLTFMADYLLLESKAKRQQAFRERYETTCKCSRCQGVTATLAQQREITSDPDYYSVSSRKDGATDVQAMNEKYVNFLNKYGHYPWCDAIGNVIDAYVHFCAIKCHVKHFLPI